MYFQWNPDITKCQGTGQLTSLWRGFVVFTNVAKYNSSPDVVAPIGLSDHNSIVFRPLKPHASSSSRSTRLVRDARSTTVIAELLPRNRSKSQLEHALSYAFEDKLQFFTTTVNSLLENHLPLRLMKANSSDKPWITMEIKDLISKGQDAWAAGKNEKFRFYRNKINAVCKKARSANYHSNIADVQQCKSCKWWLTTKLLWLLIISLRKT